MTNISRVILVLSTFLVCGGAQAQLKMSTDITRGKPSSGSAPAAVPPANTTSTAELTPEQIQAFESAGRAAATVWLTQLDSGMWGESWDQASRLFKSNVPLSTWMDNAPKDRGALGRATERTISDSVFLPTMTGQPAGAYVTVLFISKFPTAGTVEELVATMREPDGRFRVVGYSKR